MKIIEQQEARQKEILEWNKDGHFLRERTQHKQFLIELKERFESDLIEAQEIEQNIQTRSPCFRYSKVRGIIYEIKELNKLIENYENN